MNKLFAVAFVGSFMLSGHLLTAVADEATKIITPQEVKWGPPPPAIPRGAQLAVLQGDPSKKEFFAMRLKLPNGLRVPPHTHPGREMVTVISGNFHLGLGQKFEEAKTKPLPAGSFFSLPPGTPHFAFAEGETVVQISTMGPFELNYLNAKDDPRTVQ
jgi:quercetin dioxygenase-like cupin family protein